MIIIMYECFNKKLSKKDEAKGHSRGHSNPIIGTSGQIEKSIIIESAEINDIRFYVLMILGKGSDNWFDKTW